MELVPGTAIQKRKCVPAKGSRFYIHLSVDFGLHRTGICERDSEVRVWAGEMPRFISSFLIVLAALLSWYQ